MLSSQRAVSSFCQEGLCFSAYLFESFLFRQMLHHLRVKHVHPMLVGVCCCYPMGMDAVGAAVHTSISLAQGHSSGGHREQPTRLDGPLRSIVQHVGDRLVAPLCAATMNLLFHDDNGDQGGSQRRRWRSSTQCDTQRVNTNSVKRQTEAQRLSVRGNS